MKKIITLLLLAAMSFACTPSKSIFVLSPNQSMLMTGKGPGQDGANNPYADGRSIAVVRNLGRTPFSVRIQQDGEVLQTANLDAKAKKEFVLEQGYELYLDADQEAKAKLTFSRIR